MPKGNKNRIDMAKPTRKRLLKDKIRVSGLQKSKNKKITQTSNITNNISKKDKKEKV